MDSASKPVITMHNKSTAGVVDCVNVAGGDRKPIADVDDAEKHTEDLGSPPFDLVYSSKESERVRWKLDLILLPLVWMLTILRSSSKMAN
jgi:hypothetical protein